MTKEKKIPKKGNVLSAKKRFSKRYKTNIVTDTRFISESVERQIERMTANKEPIKAISGVIYANGIEVDPRTDIRADKQELACQEISQTAKEFQMKRSQVINGDFTPKIDAS